MRYDPSAHPTLNQHDLFCCDGLLEVKPEGAALRDAYWHMGLMTLALVLFTLRLLLGIEQFQVRASEPVLLLISGAGYWFEAGSVAAWYTTTAWDRTTKQGKPNGY